MNPAVLPYLASLLRLTPQRVYLVGGSVRDLLIGIGDIKDFDLSMPSGSESVAQAFADRIGGSFFFLDEERKISRVVKRDAGGDVQFDFTNFEGPDLTADLGRRDFTVNAMALDLRTFLATGTAEGLIDPFDGSRDVREGIVRVTRPDVLDDDPLRLLRAVRFAALLGFRIDPKTQDHIRSRADLTTRPAPERIRDELFQVLAQRGAGSSLALMDGLGLLSPLFPELDALGGFSPGMYHTHDVRTHSLKTVEQLDFVLDDLPKISPDHHLQVLEHLDEHLEHPVPRKAALRFACLLHDIAKPDTFTHDESGHIHFYGHDNLGALKAKDTCGRFRLSRDTESMVTSVIKHHMRLFNLSAPGGPGKNAMYRYCRDLGDALPESLLLSQADARATYDLMPRDRFMDTEKPMAAVLDYYYVKFLKTEAKPLVTGQDLIDAGLTPGPRFRELLDLIKERQAAGTLRDRQEALDFIDNMK